MAAITTVVNIVVILAFSRRKSLSNNQTTYKLSLAAADLLVGVFVLPTCVYTLYTIVGTPLTTDVKRTVTGYQLINESYVEVETHISDRIHENLRKKSLSPAYIDAVGFVTTVSIFVSIYTLAGAGFDRFRAVYKPLSYDKFKANKIAKISSLLAWILAIFIAVVPIFNPANILHYGIIFSLIVATLNFSGIILYIFLFFIPLFIVWVVNIAVYVVTKRHNRSRRILSVCSAFTTTDAEKKLATTLQLMVGIFTFNTLPLWITLFCNLFIPNVSIERPETLNTKAMFALITVQAVSAVLLLGNSLCNFFIYNIRSEEFRETVKELVLDKMGLTACWENIYICLQSSTGQGRRRLSSVSLNLFNIHFRKRTSTDETSFSSNTRKNKTISSSKSDQEERSPSAVPITTRSKDHPSTRENEASVFNHQFFSEYDNIDMSFQSSFMSRFDETSEQV